MKLPSRIRRSIIENRSIALSSIATFAMLGGVGAVQFVQMLIFSRTLGASALGVYLAGFAIFRIAQTVSQLGLESAALRFVAQGKSVEEWGAVGRTLLVSMLAALVAGVLAGGVVLTVAPYLPSQSLDVLWCLALAVGPSAACVVAANAIRGLSYNVLSLAFSGLIAPAVSIAVFVMVAQQPGAGRAAMSFALGQAVAFVVVSLFLLVTARRFPNNEGKLDAARLFKVALPLSAVNLSVLCNDVFSVAILSWFHSPEQVAFLGVCGRIMLVIGFLLHAINRTNEARFAGFSRVGDRDAIRRLYVFATGMAIAVAAPTMLAIALLAKPLLRLFGAEFEQAQTVLLILLAGQLVNAALGPSGSLLIMDDGQKAAATISAVSVAIFLVLAFALTPTFAAAGMAAAVSTSLLYRKVHMSAIVFRLVWRPKLPL